MTARTPLTSTVIAEDEPLARDSLAAWVQLLPQLQLVASVGDGASALQAIRQWRPALVLMDIQMPGLTGLQVLRALAADAAADPGTPAPRVIFTTAYDQYALTAFELHAVDYLLKPFAHERFVEAVTHALETVVAPGATGQALDAAQQRADGDNPGPLSRVLVRDQGKIFPLQAQAIEYLRSDTKYTAIVSQGRSYLVRLPITSFEARLDPQRFLKISRSCIVNLDFVDTMTPDESSQSWCKCATARA